jgi:glycosyltransferase involved in cell wall biosynthesis
VIDGIFFQLNEWSGIAKYWRELLRRIDDYLDELPQGDFLVYLLIRGSSSPLRDAEYKRINKLFISYFDYRCALSDYNHLGILCRELGATAFISTFYTIAYGVPNLGMAYDFIPERIGLIDSHPMWAAKALYMESLSHAFAISEATAADANRFYPRIRIGDADIFYPIIDTSEFGQVNATDERDFRCKSGLTYPFIAFVGNRHGYKNFDLMTKALDHFSVNNRPLPAGLVLSSGEEFSHAESRALLSKFEFGIRQFRFDQAEMKCFLHCAEFLFYPTLMEGFGYPVVEALAQGCPVITSGSTSIPEILRYARDTDYVMVNGYDGRECLQAILDLLHCRRRSSHQARQALMDAFCTNPASRFLQRVLEVSPTLKEPEEMYLSSCLPLDGLLA